MQKASKGLLSLDVDLLQFHIENVSIIYIQDAWMSNQRAMIEGSIEKGLD